LLLWWKQQPFDTSDEDGSDHDNESSVRCARKRAACMPPEANKQHEKRSKVGSETWLLPTRRTKSIDPDSGAPVLEFCIEDESGHEFTFVIDVKMSTIEGAGRGAFIRFTGTTSSLRKFSLSDTSTMIDVGIYARAKEDRMSHTIFSLKNFIFSGEPESWSFDAAAGSQAANCLDITDDATGLPHEVASAQTMMYVNESTDTESSADKSIVARHDKLGNVHYLWAPYREISLNDPDCVELLTDYGKHYENVRVRKGYGDNSSLKFVEHPRVKIDSEIKSFSVDECRDALSWVSRVLQRISDPIAIRRIEWAMDRVLLSVADMALGRRRAMSATVLKEVQETLSVRFVAVLASRKQEIRSTGDDSNLRLAAEIVDERLFSAGLCTDPLCPLAISTLTFVDAQLTEAASGCYVSSNNSVREDRLRQAIERIKGHVAERDRNLREIAGIDFEDLPKSTSDSLTVNGRNNSKNRTVNYDWYIKQQFVGPVVRFAANSLHAVDIDAEELLTATSGR
jgi:hypothetical protein